MKKYTNFNMSNESSGNNDINNIVLKKKTLDGIDLEENNSNNVNEKNNTPVNTPSNIENKSVIGKEEFKQTDPNYHSGILERKVIEEKASPSVLIIFIIIIAVFFGEVIYSAVFNKGESNEPGITNNGNNTNENEVTENNETSDNDGQNSLLDDLINGKE